MRKILLFSISIIAAVCATWPVRTQPRAFELDYLNRIIRITDPRISPDGRRIAVLTARANLQDDRFDSEVDLIDVASAMIRPVTFDRRGVASPRWSPSGDRLAFLAEGAKGSNTHPQIFVMTMSGGDAEQITDVPNGVQQFAWSPDGGTFAFATADEVPKKTGAEKFNDAFEVGNDDFTITEAPASTHLWLVPATGSAVRRLTSGAWSMPVSFPPGPPSSPIAWAPDGRSLAIAKVPTPHSGDVNESVIVLIDAKTGSVTPITGAKRLEGYPAFSRDGSQVAYWYQRDADANNVNDVLVARAAGGPGRNVSSALDRNIFRAEWMPNGRSLLLGANDTTQVGLWLQPLDGAARRLDTGTVSIATSFWVEATTGDHGEIVFVGSAPQRPAEVYYMASATAPVRRLTDLNRDVASLNLGRVDTIEWQSDKYTHNGILTYPPTFTAGQKYPLVLVIHGGPQAASLLSFNAQAQLLAAHGWVVFNPNYRGSDQRGNAYMRAIVNDAGAGPGRDVMAGVAAVKKLGFVDESRVAVTGWSYGGYMTTWLIGHYPGWRVAVAGAPVTDAVDQAALSDNGPGWAEAFGVSPWTTGAEAYRVQSPITYTANMRTPTLIMSDTGDFRVPPMQAFKLYHALKDNGVETKFVAYPVAGHFPRDPVRSRDVYHRWVDWIEQHFAGRPATNE